MNTEYIVSLTRELIFPEEAVECIKHAANTVDEKCGELFSDASHAFRRSEYSFGGMDHRFSHIAELTGISEYTVALLFLLSECEDLERRYSEAGYSRELFIETMTDLKYKLDECKMIYDVWGNFVSWWYQGFFNMTRFGIGRFQYEFIEFAHDRFGAQGNFVKKGDRVLNIHIPASKIPLSDEVRLDSYRRAKEFFFPNSSSSIPIGCSSWLLWPGYEEYIPKHLNLLKFRHDFTIISCKESDDFGNAWRVFGKDCRNEPDKLPRNTSQQRLFADYIKDGKKHGSAYGIFFFDGEKIIK